MLAPVLLCCYIAAYNAVWTDPGDKDTVLNKYFSNEYIQLKLMALQKTYPDKIAMRSLGKTPGGHDMWSCVVTNNVTNWKHQGKPGVKYVANMHGNEVRGRSLLLKYATFLCQEDDKEIVDMLNKTVIHLVPTMNPDGFKRAEEGGCMANEGRYTNGGVDLNRDFPDHWHSGTKLKFADETKYIMEYAKDVDASLSINFHDGSLVVNYPWDASSSSSSLRAGDYSASPDDAQFRHLALTYAKNHPVLQTADAKCSDSQRFDQGITNGNQWYPVNNGMQDWNYFYQECFEVTVELGCCKYPKGADYFNKETWQQNINSLVEYTKQVNLMGITGTVKDIYGNPLLGAKISVVGVDKKITVKNSQGHYWRLLVAGKYNITAEKEGFYSLSFKSVRVHENKQTLRNFILMSNKSQPWRRPSYDDAKKDKKKDKKAKDENKEDVVVNEEANTEKEKIINDKTSGGGIDEARTNNDEIGTGKDIKDNDNNEGKDEKTETDNNKDDIDDLEDKNQKDVADKKENGGSDVAPIIVPTTQKPVNVDDQEENKGNKTATEDDKKGGRNDSNMTGNEEGNKSDPSSDSKSLNGSVALVLVTLLLMWA